METWSWEQMGRPSGFAPVRVSPVLIQDKEAGYQVTRPKFTKDIWKFQIEYARMKPSAYIWLVNFFHLHRGGQLFYFQWPFGGFGIPEEYQEPNPGSPLPFSTEIAVGYGEGPVHIARFVSTELAVKRLRAHDNYWATTSPIEIVQV